MFELGDPLQIVSLAAPVSNADLQLNLVYSLHVGAPRHVWTSIFGERAMIRTYTANHCSEEFVSIRGTCDTCRARPANVGTCREE
jgi:hypothetical protein